MLKLKPIQYRLHLIAILKHSCIDNNEGIHLLDKIEVTKFKIYKIKIVKMK
jgi:hypothetical protein